jgi:hypothetical protein
MEAFFARFPMSAGEKRAVKMISDKVKSSLEKLEADKTSLEYLTDLAKGYEMMDVFFKEKGIDVSTLL